MNFLKEVSLYLEGVPQDKALLYRNMLLPIINKHISEFDKQKIIMEWHIDILEYLNEDLEREFGTKGGE